MIDYSPILVSKLKTVLPTHYELICDSDTEKPCITWTESNNYDDIRTDGAHTSVIEYSIKIWANDIKTISINSVKIDEVLRESGFERVSSNEISIDNQICKIFIYRIRGIEY